MPTSKATRTINELMAGFIGKKKKRVYKSQNRVDAQGRTIKYTPAIQWHLEEIGEGIMGAGGSYEDNPEGKPYEHEGEYDHDMAGGVSNHELECKCRGPWAIIGVGKDDPNTKDCLYAHAVSGEDHYLEPLDGIRTSLRAFAKAFEKRKASKEA